MKQCLVYCRDFLFLSMWSSVSGRVMDQKKEKNTRNSPWSDVLWCGVQKSLLFLINNSILYLLCLIDDYLY